MFHPDWTVGSFRVNKAAQSANASFQYKMWQMQKNYVLGPYLDCSLVDKQVRLFIPMVTYHKEIWNFWRNKKFVWDGKVFRMDVPKNANQEKWLQRATDLYYQMWDNVNERKEWNEN